jgi:hypothetical protein
MQIHALDPICWAMQIQYVCAITIAYNTFSDLLVLQFVTNCNFNNNNSS